MKNSGYANTGISLKTEMKLTAIRVTSGMFDQTTHGCQKSDKRIIFKQIFEGDFVRAMKG